MLASTLLPARHTDGASTTGPRPIPTGLHKGSLNSQAVPSGHATSWRGPEGHADQTSARDSSRPKVARPSEPRRSMSQATVLAPDGKRRAAPLLNRVTEPSLRTPGSGGATPTDTDTGPCWAPPSRRSARLSVGGTHHGRHERQLSSLSCVAATRGPCPTALLPPPGRRPASTYWPAARRGAWRSEGHGLSNWVGQLEGMVMTRAPAPTPPAAVSCPTATTPAGPPGSARTAA